MRRIVRKDDAKKSPKRRMRPAFPARAKRIDYSQTNFDKLIFNKKVSELIVSFKKTSMNHE